jgi:hypothetical protein
VHRSGLNQSLAADSFASRPVRDGVHILRFHRAGRASPVEAINLGSESHLSLLVASNRMDSLKCNLGRQSKSVTAPRLSAQVLVLAVWVAAYERVNVAGNRTAPEAQSSPAKCLLPSEVIELIEPA